MNTRFRANYIWSSISLTVVIILVAAAWFAGRASISSTTQAAGGYDIGVAAKPQPTGKVREFQLVAKEASWEIMRGVAVPAITYNGQVPGPLIRVTEGNIVRVTLKNELNEATAIHWHGLHVPNTMDGVPPLTQQPIEPGATFTYEFPASHAGTFMYHSHLNAAEQIDRGLYGTLIIDPAQSVKTKFDKEFTMMIGAWNVNAMAVGGHTMDNGQAMSGQDAMAMNYNYFTINGKAFPDAPAWTVKEGDLVRVRIMNISNLVHPMHLHGGDFTVVAKDGEPIRPELQQTMNTLPVNAGETFDIVFRADNPGTWVFHCHELHHTENDGVEPGGLIQVIQYEGYTPPQANAPTTSPTAMPSSMPGMNH